jgi:hypothetical protein
VLANELRLHRGDALAGGHDEDNEFEASASWTSGTGGTAVSLFLRFVESKSGKESGWDSIIAAGTTRTSRYRSLRVVLDRVTDINCG